MATSLDIRSTMQPPLPSDAPSHRLHPVAAVRRSHVTGLGGGESSYAAGQAFSGTAGNAERIAEVTSPAPSAQSQFGRGCLVKRMGGMMEGEGQINHQTLIMSLSLLSQSG